MGRHRPPRVLPALDPESRGGLWRAAAELAPVLLPPLFARLEGARAQLTELARRLTGDPEEWAGNEGLFTAADAFGGRDAQYGWCLGVLAAALGADLLGVRREREGLRLLVELLAEGRGVRLDPEARALPLVATGRGAGWELPLAGAYFFLAVTGAEGVADVLRWRVERSAGRRVFVCPDAPPLAPGTATWSAVLGRMPGASLLGEDAGHAALAVPEPWIEDQRRGRSMSVMGQSPCGGSFPGANNQPPEPTGDPERIAEVQKVLGEVRPFLQADGGDIFLLSVEDDWVNVRLQGACMGCHASAMTLQQGVEPRLREACPWIKGVRAM